MNRVKPDRGFRIGRCQVQPSSLSMQIDGCEKQTLQPKFIEVIAYLAERYPDVVPRQELIDTIWDGNEHVGEKSLTNAIWHLRQSLKPADDDGETIETIRKIGYRLLKQPQWLEAGSSQKTPSDAGGRQPDRPLPPADKLAITKFLVKVIAYSLFLPGTILLAWYYLTEQGKTHIPVSQQVTRDPGSEIHVAPSPDGRYIVYRWQSFGRQINLFMRDLHQPQMPAQQLTFDRINQRFSVWSNDGQYLYFHRKNTLEEVCDIVRMNVATKQEQSVAHCSLHSGFIYIDISPDDKTLAYQGYSEKTKSSGIYFIDLDNLEAEPVRFSCEIGCGYRDRDMAFSPNGEKIAVTRRVSAFDENIYLVDLATKKAERLTEGEEDITGLTWHPNGRKIVYGTQRSDLRNGYVVDIQSKKIQNLSVEGFSYPAYSKKTAELFYAHRGDNSGILSLQVNDAVSRNPFPVVASEFSHHSPNYSSVTDKIVYVSNESGHDELWTIDSDGGNRQQLSYLRKSVRDPRWSRGGDRIVFIGPTEQGSGEGIYVIDAGSGRLTAVPTTYDDFDRPSWSYDDSAIILAIHNSGDRDIYRFDLKDGAVEQLTFDGGRFGVMISPTTLLYTRDGRGLWQKDININSAPIEKVDGKYFSHPYAWVYSDGDFYFRRNRSNHYQIIHYDFKQQEFTTLVHLPKRTFRSYGTLSFMPKESKLLYAGTQSPQADIKKLEHPLLP